MNDDDVTYFKRREQEERQRADSCAETGIARVHLQMADGYKNALRAAAPSELNEVPSTRHERQ